MSPAHMAELQRRDGLPSSDVWIIVGSVAVALIAVTVFVHQLRRFRFHHPDPPSFLPGQYLKDRWRRWKPSYYKKIDGSHPTGASTHLSYRPSSEHTGSASHLSTEIESGVNRNVSIRSVVTLPPYRFDPLPSERLIAREGERAGVDTIIELPQSEEDIEARREAEMHALYNIRETRRREAADRDERRRQRQAARDAGDWRRLQELEEESRARQRQRENSETTITSTLEAAERGEIELTQPTSTHLIAELTSLRETNSRHGRRVSSVSYADLGLAHHDGSRIRADSFESDQRPLLDSSASMGGRRSRATSRASSQGRSRSVASQGGGTPAVLSPDYSGRSNHNRHASDEAPSVMSNGSESPRSRAANLLTPQSSAGGPPEDPPSYEDDISVHGGEAPPYESPVQERAPGLPAANPGTEATAHGEDEEGLRSAARMAQSYISSHPSEERENGAVPRGISSPATHSGTQEQQNLNQQQQQQQHKPPPQLPQLAALRTESLITPAIEVSSATPVNSVPTTPIEEPQGRRTIV